MFKNQKNLILHQLDDDEEEEKVNNEIKKILEIDLKSERKNLIFLIHSNI